MLKTILICTTIALSISSCGFHTPYRTNLVNATIQSNENNSFAIELKKRFTQNVAKSLILQIGNEIQNTQPLSYSNDTIISYTLNLIVPIKIFNQDNQLLMAKDLSANTYYNKNNVQASISQADKLAISQNYAQLRNNIINRLLIQLNKLDEN